MRRTTIVQLLAVLVALVALTASGVLAVQISASAGRNRLSYTDSAIEGQPEQVAAGIAMGAFRGLFVNILWIRANQMKEDGRFHEAIDLAKAITTLQPRFPQVWVFHAWNMAYNISVQTKTNTERWTWVDAGIKLLRDKAIPANPNDLLIHKELAWIFIHKIGAYMDDSNLYYKRQLAAEWSLVLGPPPRLGPKERGFDAATRKYAAWLEPIARAPDSLADVIAAEPSVRTLVDQLSQSGIGVKPGLARNYVIAKTILDSAERGLFERRFTDPKYQVMFRLIPDPALAKAWDALIPHLRKRILTDEYHMEPDRMIRYTLEFGPIDWRHFAAHGLYWATRGFENALLRYTKENRKDFDFINSGRMVIHAVQDLWRSGEVHYDLLAWIKDPDSPRISLFMGPDVLFIESYGKRLEKYVNMSWADKKSRVYSMYSAGYENFMKDAIRFLYRRGERERAQNLKDELGVWQGQNLTDPDRIDLFKLSLDDFVKKELEEQLTRPSVAREEVVGALQAAYVSGLLARDQEAFRSNLEYAKSVHAFFFSRQSYRNLLDPSTVRMEQIDSNFAVVAGQTFAMIASTLDLTDAETIYDQAPTDLKRWAYDTIRELFKKGMDDAVADGGKPFDAAFPEPEGMPAHRAMLQRLEAERKAAMPGVERQ